MGAGAVVEEKWPVLARHERAAEWLRIWADLGRAPRTIDAYARGLAEYLQVCERDGIDPMAATRAQVGVFIRELTSRPSRRGPNVLALDSGAGLSNATLQQRLVPVRLFYDFLMEEGLRESNPVGRGSYTPGRRFGGGHGSRPLVPRMVKLPWIPAEAEWLRILEVFRGEAVRNRLMLAMAYDAALRREELCSLRTDDLDPAHRMLRVRAETTKTRRERMVPYSAPTGVLLSDYLRHRAVLSRARGPLFLSESRRNLAEPLTLWTWSKVVRRIALAAEVPRFSTHTTRHLCLTDLARMGWELHAIATFAGHRSTDSTLRYIHLSGRELSEKLSLVMSQIHAWRVSMLTEPACGVAGRGSGVTAAGCRRLPSSGPGRGLGVGLDVSGWDRRRGADRPAKLRRSPRSARPGCAAAGPAGPGVRPARGRLVPAGRAARSGGGRSSSRPQRCPLAGRGARGRRSSCSTALTPGRRTGPGPAGTGPGWPARRSREFLDGQALPTETAVRPFLVALAYLLGGFSDFQHLGMFNRLHLARLVFGTEAVDAATCEATAVLDRWGYRSQVRDGEYKLPRRARPGAADQPQPSPGRPDHRGVRPAARPPRGRRPPAPGDALRAAARGRLARLLRSAGAPRLQPRARHRGNRSRVGRLGRAVACHLAADAQGPRDHPHHRRQGGSVAGGRAPRDHRARPVDPADLRGTGSQPSTA